jgi:hypothetical protein
VSNTTPLPVKPEETGFISSLAKAVRESEGNPLRAVGGVASAVGQQALRGL